MASNVIFKVGTKAQYSALTTKDPSTLYWLSDVQELYKGDVLYGKGKDATALASGLMSAADKAKLDSITDMVIPEYSMERQSSDGSVTKYRMKKTVGDDVSYVGDEINIPVDLVISGGSIGTVTEADKPYTGAEAGDYYIDLILNDADSTHIYVPANELFKPNTAGFGIKIENGEVSIVIDPVNSNGLTLGAGGLGMNLATDEKAGAMSAVDKVALDGLASDMVQVKADLEVLKTTGTTGGLMWETI